MTFDPDAFLASQAPEPQQPQSSPTGFDPDAFLQSKNADIIEQQDTALQNRYGTPGQQALAGAEAVGKGLAGPLATGFETKVLGVPGEDILGREEANPVTRFAGETAGLLSPVGEGALLSKLGAGAVKGLGITSKVGSVAVRAATEGALYQSGDEASKMLAGAYDNQAPGQAAQTMAVNVGLGALIGGGFGTAFGVLHPAWQSTVGDKLGGYLDAFQRRANGESILDPKLEAATNALNTTLPPEIKSAISTYPELNRIGGLLDETLTSPGVAFKESLKKVNEELENSALNTIGKTTEDVENAKNYSKGAHAENTIDALNNELKERYAPIKEGFEGTQEKFAATPLTDEVKGSVADNIGKYAIDEHLTEHPDSPEMNFVNRATKMVQESKTGLGLKKAVESLGAQANKEGLWHLWGDIQDHIFDGIDTATQSAIKDPEALQNYLNLRQQYRSLAKDYGQVSKQLNLGKFSGPGGMIYKLENYPAKEKLLDRLLPKDNAAFLQELDKYPQTKKLVQDNQAQQLLKRSMFKDQFNLNKFVKNISNMTPEVRQLTFPEGSEAKLDAINKIKSALDRLPSNTSHTSGFLSALQSKLPSSAMGMAAALIGKNPIIGFMLGKAGEWLGRDVPDAARLGLLKFLGSEAPINPGAFKTAVDFSQHLLKGLKATNGAVENLFKSGSKMIPDILRPTKEDIKKLDKQLQALQVSPKDLLDVGGDTGYYMPEHATALSQMTTTATNYLNSLRPSTQKAAPLDPEVIVSKDAQEKYDKALEVAQQPLIVLEKLHNGEVDSQDIRVMQTIYPRLYQSLQQKVMNQITSHISKDGIIPYKMTIALSHFLNTPLNSTLTPQSIASNQMALQGPQLSQQNAKPTKSTVGGLKELKLNDRAKTKEENEPA